MQKMIGNLRENAWKHFITFLVFVLLFVFYWRISGIYTVLFLFGLIVPYGFAVAFCEKGKQKFLRAKREDCLTPRDAFRYAIQMSAPFYWCWFVVSLFPIMTWELWLITAIPPIVLTGMPLVALADVVYNKKTFWLVQVAMYLLMLLCGRLFVGVWVKGMP
ncbi:MAG: hypothetical protein J6B12_05430 [Clostridia bacterium]|nr:hypothetical protein [Clostridia bacterium]